MFARAPKLGDWAEQPRAQGLSWHSSGAVASPGELPCRHLVADRLEGNGAWRQARGRAGKCSLPFQGQLLNAALRVVLKRGKSASTQHTRADM